MTTPSSCKSFFKPYLIYKLRTQTITFVISALFNLLTLPLLATEMFSFYIVKNVTDSYPRLVIDSVPDIIYFFGVFVLFIMAVTGGARAFRSCVKKDAVDTLAALPLTRREQFTADFLSGYIANVGPFFPCAVIAIILSIPSDKYFSISMSYYLNETNCGGPISLNGFLTTWFFVLVIGLFLLYTLSYIVSVFAAVCCGSPSSSIIFTAAISTLMMIAGAGIGSYVKQCITGMDTYNTDYYLCYIPPFGLLGFMYENYSVMYGINFSETQKYPLPSLVGIILLIIAGAAVTYASYRIFKSRQSERTGKVIASNVIYRTFCALSVIAITSVAISALYIFGLTWLAVLIALAITAVLVIVMEAIRSFKKTGLIITGTRCLITMAVCVIALVIVDKTGVFGARYINVSPSNIEHISIESDSGFTYYDASDSDINYVRTAPIQLGLSDQKDIEKFLELHNQTLKQHSKELKEGQDFLVNIYLKNGENIYREYGVNRRLINGYTDETIDELDNNLRLLPSYNLKASEFIAQKLEQEDGIKVEIKDTFGAVEIPNEHIHELIDIFAREFREKYTPADTTAGIFIYKSIRYMGSNSFDIPSSCTETLEFVNALRGDNSECTALILSMSQKGVEIKCPITVKETESELGRELMSLLSDEYEYYPGFINVYSSNLNKYYVRKENFDRVLEIALQFIEEKYSAGA